MVSLARSVPSGGSGVSAISGLRIMVLPSRRDDGQVKRWPVRIAQDTLLSALFLLPPTLVGVATIAEAIFDAAWITSSALLSAGFLIVPTAIVCGWDAARSASFSGPY